MKVGVELSDGFAPKWKLSGLWGAEWEQVVCLKDFAPSLQGAEWPREQVHQRDFAPSLHGAEWEQVVCLRDHCDPATSEYQYKK